MNWETLIEETARRAGTDRQTAALTLDSFFDAVIRSMETEECIQLRSDFGCFEMREAGGEYAQHSQSLPKGHRTPVFKKAAELKKQLRQSDEEYLRMLRQTGHEEQARRVEELQRERKRQD